MAEVVDALSVREVHPDPRRRGGNRRTGAVKGTRGRRRGQLAWRKDDLILERVNLVRTLNAQGYTAAQTLPLVNELMKKRGVPTLSIDTVYEDRTRVRELQDEERLKAQGIELRERDRHIEEIRLVMSQAWTAFHTTAGTSLNRGAYLNVILRGIETIAKLDGSMAAVKVTVEHDATELQRLVDDAIPDAAARERLALRILEGGLDSLGAVGTGGQ